MSFEAISVLLAALPMGNFPCSYGKFPIVWYCVLLHICCILFAINEETTLGVFSVMDSKAKAGAVKRG
jgi:hypothetical protein